MMCRPLCVDHVAPAAERFGADSEIADAKKPFIPGSDFKTTIRAHMTGGRGKIWRGFGNCGREEAVYARRRLPNPRSSADDRRPRKDSARIRKLRTRRSLLCPAVPPKPRSSTYDRRPRKDSARIRKLRTRRSFIYPVVSAGNGRSRPQTRQNLSIAPGWF